MQRFVKLPVPLFAVHRINSFGSFVVALGILRADRLPTQCDFVGLHNFRAIHQSQRSFALLDDNPIDARRGLRDNSGSRLYTNPGEHKQARNPEQFSFVVALAGHGWVVSRLFAYPQSYELPMSQPVRNTSRPPTPPRNAACQKG